MTEPVRIGAILEALQRAGVDFVVIGGMAVLAHGGARPTFDLDVVYARDAANIRRLVAALGDLDATLRVGGPESGEALPFVLDERTIENGANFTFDTRLGPLDVLGDAAGAPAYEQLRAAAVEVEMDGIPVRVARIDHLVAMKRASGRPKDLQDVEEYLVIAEEQARMRKEEGS